MNVQAFIHGATAMACAAVALFFFRFWRAGRDRFFLLFGIAFLVLAANRLLLTTVQVSAESTPYLYALRLVSFLVIAFAVWDKNRAGA